MARSLSLVLTQAKNQIESTDPFLWCFEVDATAFPAPIRFVSDIQTMTFQGQQFDPFPVSFDGIKEHSEAQRQSTNAVVANVDQQVVSLLEQFWAPVLSPDWTVKIWRVLASAPDETPLASAVTFEVVAVTCDMIAARFQLQAARIPTRVRETGRRWTRAEFPFIPRLR